MTDRPERPQVPEEALAGLVRTNLDSPAPTERQLARRDRSLSILKKLGVPSLAGLPVTEPESSIRPRSSAEVADRCVAIVLCAVKGEGADQPLIEELIADFDAANLFTPHERDFIHDPKPIRQNLIDFCWQYEAAHVLLWALGQLEQLNPASQICDVPTEVRIVRDQGRKGLADGSPPRAMSEIMDQADLYYHLHWSAIELRLRGASSPKLDEGVIRERHRALNWLIRYMDAEWDDVRTDT